MGLISQWAEHFALWIWLVVGIVCYRAGHAALLYKQRQALKEKFGVQEAIQLPQSRFLRGLDTAQASLKAIEEHRFLALLDKYFQHSNRTTLQFYNAGRHMHMTIDPQNLRVIHLTEHKKWQFNRRRKAGFSLLLGKGEKTCNILLSNLQSLNFLRRSIRHLYGGWHGLEVLP